jgi:hypothetical protein
MHWFIFLQAPIQVVSFGKSKIDEAFQKDFLQKPFCQLLHTSKQYFNLPNFLRT